MSSRILPEFRTITKEKQAIVGGRGGESHLFFSRVFQRKLEEIWKFLYILPYDGHMNVDYWTKIKYYGINLSDTMIMCDLQRRYGDRNRNNKAISYHLPCFTSVAMSPEFLFLCVSGLGCSDKGIFLKHGFECQYTVFDTYFVIN